MKAQALLYFFFAVALYPCGSHDLFFPVPFSHLVSNNEQLILGRYDEDVILPCPFTSGADIVIHWRNQNNYVHSYFGGKDHLEAQYFRYENRTSLFHGEIHNGNASLTIRRLSLLDEGIYSCYVGTKNERTDQRVVLKVGAFHTPLMKYEQRNTESFLECSILSIYPHAHITWKMDNADVSESNSEENSTLGPFYIKSTLNITGSNSSFECAIGNSLLNQTWRGEWTLAGSHWMNQSESISLWCTVSRNFSLQNEDFHVTWSRVENGIYSVLDWHLNYSQDTTTNDPQFSRKKELRNHSGFPITLKHLRASDSGEYLCNVSSTEYTLLTVHRLHVAQSQGRVSRHKYFIVPSVALFLVVLPVWYCKVRRDSSDSEGTRRSTYSANGDQCIPDPTPEKEVHCGSDDVMEYNSEMCRVSVDESVNNGNNSNGNDVRHIISS
ncbi:HERV-H LTR-associating protein 2 [Mesocricetus auratus]|uniref:HERV-H LTR-associating protein 2 n=1 Tax=Mesocricetus auratus TaxID=10036 RepID=A0ABM2XVG2_MESAU|nr:HERV-H LTR-associating protein 2 [Mesocricetus auratus]XP_040606661.1 HERV-H LTR-associating protein 2 [Mesocricetus auratus]XP_040606662.1 HERV-H LTR-associating protein 2 [Mesocricetus auratus]